jgi:carbamoylphosphate synthase small subunit
MPSNQSNDVARPSRLAKLYLEDGSVLVGKSFGAPQSVDGEVSVRWSLMPAV